MRGVVSLAAALSVPVHLPGGGHFPQRNLILFITFVVILVTLVLQGLTLPWLIKKMNTLLPGEELSGTHHYHNLYRRLHAESYTWVQQQFAGVIEQNPALQQAVNKLGSKDDANTGINLNQQCKSVMLQLIEQQRHWLLLWNKDHDVEEEQVRMHLYRLDLEEERLKYL
jgi:CPA1 family monovalent cation:H+ antiporter